MKASYRVIENGSELAGGYSEKNLVSYTGLVANDNREYKRSENSNKE